MAKRGRPVTRREFLRDTALAAGGLAAAGALTTDLLAQSTPPAGGAAPKLGAQLIGKLEGPELVLDPAKWPKKFAEAPALAELVKAGKLPPVDKRLPEEPLVIKPLQGIGRYGGTWRRGFTGPGDVENGTASSPRTRSSSGTTPARRSCPASPRSGRSPTTAGP